MKNRKISVKTIRIAMLILVGISIGSSFMLPIFDMHIPGLAPLSLALVMVGFIYFTWLKKEQGFISNSSAMMFYTIYTASSIMMIMAGLSQIFG